MAYDRSKTVGRVAFLAHRDAIRDLLDKGHRNKEVFAKLEDQLTISYSQFNRYVVRYITGANDDRHQRKGPGQIVLQSPFKPAEGGAGERTVGNSSPSFNPRQKRAEFKHDPNSGNNRDDLI